MLKIYINQLLREREFHKDEKREYIGKMIRIQNLDRKNEEVFKTQMREDWGAAKCSR